MKFRVILSFILLSFFSFSNHTHSQDNKIEFVRYTIDLGLSQSTVNCIYKDSRGFLWFGTEDGLNRFDGYEFKKYRSDPENPQSLSDNFITAVTEDEHGNLWIGTDGGGLNFFNTRTEKFTSYRNNPSNRNSLCSDEVRTLYYAGRGELWIGTAGEGLDKLDITDGKFTHFRSGEGEKDLSSNFITVLYPDMRKSGGSFNKTGDIWVGTNDGLNKLNVSTGSFFKYYNGKKDSIKSIVRSMFISGSHPGTMWIGTEDGLYSMNLKQLKEHSTSRADGRNSKNFSYLEWENKGLSGSSVRALDEYKNGVKNSLLAGTFREGLALIDYVTGRAVMYRNNPSSSSSLSDNSVLSIYRDDTGLTWIGTDANGINKIDLNEKKFLHFKLGRQNRNSLNLNFVWTICRDKNGIIWIGSNGGLIKFDEKTNSIKFYTHKKYNPNSLSDNKVISIYEDPDSPGRLLWIGTWSGGLNLFDIQKGTFKHYYHDENDKESISPGLIKMVRKDKFDKTGNTYWVATGGGGLNKFNFRTKKFVHYVHNQNDPRSISHDFLWFAEQDSAGFLWCGTKGGLNKFDPTTGKFTVYREILEDVLSIGNNFVITMLIDRAGRYWFGTFGGGLNLFNPAGGTFTRISKKDGLANDVVYGILEDSRGNLWASTNKGLSHIIMNPEYKNYEGLTMFPKTTVEGIGPVIFRNYSIEDGLQSNEFNAGAYFKDKGGRMFFGGINGFNAFYPERLKLNMHIPEVMFTKFKKFDNEYMPDTAITYLKILNLSYEDHVISFEAAALDYMSPDENNYAYKLEGFNKNWIKLGTKRDITFTNLDPGSYTLRIIAANNDGIWNKKGAALAIVITPPYWMTWWFRGLVILFLASGTLFFYSLRTKSITRWNRQLQEKNEQLNKEIEEKNMMQDALQESEKRFRALFENSSLGIYISDSSGRIKLMNPALYRLLGISEKVNVNMINLHQDFLTDPEEVKRFEKYIKENGAVIGFETSLKRGNGEVIYIRENALTVRDGRGENLIEGSLENITEKRIAENALLEAKVRAEKSDMLKSEFLAQMSHEIRTPINTILSFSNLLRDELEEQVDEDLRYGFRGMENAGKRIIRTIELILNMSEIQTGSFEYRESLVDLYADIFSGLVNEYSVLAKNKGLEFSFVMDSPKCIVTGDKYTLNQIFANLLDNAIKYTKRGGIEIVCRSVKGEGVTVKISDTGIGISKEYLPYVFEPFTQEDRGYTRRYEGNGLGLALVKKYCEYNNAEVSVESEKGTGTSFTLKFTEAGK